MCQHVKKGGGKELLTTHLHFKHLGNTQRSAQVAVGPLSWAPTASLPTASLMPCAGSPEGHLWCWQGQKREPLSAGRAGTGSVCGDRREGRSRQSLVDGKISSLLSTIATRGIKRSYKQQNIYFFKRWKLFTCIENLLWKTPEK